MNLHHTIVVVVVVVSYSSWSEKLIGALRIEERSRNAAHFAYSKVHLCRVDRCRVQCNAEVQSQGPQGHRHTDCETLSQMKEKRRRKREKQDTSGEHATGGSTMFTGSSGMIHGS